MSQREEQTFLVQCRRRVRHPPCIADDTVTIDNERTALLNSTEHDTAKSIRRRHRTALIRKNGNRMFQLGGQPFRIFPSAGTDGDHRGPVAFQSNFLRRQPAYVLTARQSGESAQEVKHNVSCGPLRGQRDFVSIAVRQREFRSERSYGRHELFVHEPRPSFHGRVRTVIDVFDAPGACFQCLFSHAKRYANTTYLRKNASTAA